MGYMTEVILIIDSQYKDKAAMIDALNAYFYGQDSYYKKTDRIPPLQEMTEEYPHSCQKIGIMHGSFKNLDEDAFCTYLASLPWFLPESVQLLLKSDSQTAYSVYMMCNGTFEAVFVGSRM